MCKDTLMIICTNSEEAGAPRHVENIINLFNERFNIVLVFGGTGAVYQRMCKRYLDCNLEVISIPFLQSALNLRDDLKSAVELYRLIRKYKPTIIHGHSSKVGFLIRLIGMMHPARIIFTVHGWSWRGFSKTKSRIYMACEWLLYNVCECEYIFVSNHTRNQASQAKINVDKRVNYVVYNYVPDKFKTQHSDRSIQSLDKYVIMPARVSGAKNHKLLIRAYELSNYNGKLILAGLNTDTNEFRHLAYSLAPQKFNKIYFLGEIENIDAYYRSSDAVMLCSNFEALPISLLEALALGQRVVASNVGGVSEILGDNEAGLLCSNTLESWVSAFNSLDDSIWVERQKKIGSMFDNNFSEGKFYDKMLAIYSK